MPVKNNKDNTVKKNDSEIEQIENNLGQFIEKEYGIRPAEDACDEPDNQTISDNDTKDIQKQEKRKRRKSNREIVIAAYICMMIIVAMIVYLGKFIAADNTEMLSNPYNKLQGVLEKYTKRGDILSADGKVLATTVTDSNGNEIREYPYGKMYAHSVGFVGKGKTGIESTYNIYMLNSSINPVYEAITELKGEKNPGDDVVTTLDSKLQKVAYDALGSYKGAVLVMNPDNGEIRAMVSKPDYNPNTIAVDWNKIVNEDDEESALLNRATQGLYPPGSTFKLITMLEYIRENNNYEDFSFQCKGDADIEGVKVNCHNKKSHGKLDINMALAKSCNGAFAKMGTSLDIESYNNTCSQLLFGKELPYTGQYSKSIFDLPTDANAGLITQTSFGQGNTMISPLHAGIIVSAIANGGYIVTPHLVSHVQGGDNMTVRSFSYSKGEQVMTDREVKALRKAMGDVVNSGTAYALSASNYKVYGKTGSAEYDSSGESHAWFVGYARKNKEKLVVSIIVEGAGTGSEYAVPIAKKIFDSY